MIEKIQPVARHTPELSRVLRFLQSTDERASTAVRRFRFGFAYFHDRLPLVWDRNFLLVESGSEPDPRSLAAAADELQGGAGLRHRKVVFEQQSVGARLAPAMRSNGWEERRLSVMVHRGSERGLGAEEAAEVDRKVLEGAVEKFARAEPYGGDEELVRQLVKADLALSRVIDQRCFAKLVEGEVVSYCRLYCGDGVAQIEDVATLPQARGRGYARAVVSRALSEGAGAQALVFLTAVDGLWVKDWYARLGFEEVALRYELTVSPRR